MGMVFLILCYLISLNEAGAGQVLADGGRLVLALGRSLRPAFNLLKRVLHRSWRILTTACTGMLLFAMIAYFTQGVDGALATGADHAVTAPTVAALTHDNAMRIQGALDWTSRHGLIDQQLRYDAIQMVARRANVTFLNVDLLNNADALSLGESLGIQSKVVPACPAPNDGQASEISGRKVSGVKLVDSGSGVHAIHDAALAHPGSIERNTMGISTANGIVVPPTKCTARIPMRTQSGKRVWLWLTDCLILSNSEYTLISVGRLASEQQVSTLYGPTGSSLTFPDTTVVPLASVDNVLVLPDDKASFSPLCGSPVVHGAEGGQNVSWQCLHRRFNCRSWDVLRNLTRCAHDPPKVWSNVLKSPPAHHCDECLQAKSDTTPSFGKLPPVTRPGSISYDIWTASCKHIHGGQTKVIGFHDQYSKVDKFYLLEDESMSSTQLAIDKYLAWCSSYNVTPWRFHTDNGLSLSGPRMKEWLAKKGIRCTTCAPYEPKQNSVIENRWRVMTNDLRTVFARHVPCAYWWYILSAQMQVAWCIPCRHPDDHARWTTPWQLWSGHHPDVRQHRVLGCLCYYKVRNPASAHNKFAMRARRAMCFGRAEDQPAYVLLDLENCSIRVTPHVRFVEDILPGMARYAQPGEPDGDQLFELNSAQHDTTVEFDDCVQDTANTSDNGQLGTPPSPAQESHELLQRPAQYDSDDDMPPAAGGGGGGAAAGGDAADLPASLQRAGRDRIRAGVDRLTFNTSGKQVGTAGEAPSGACKALLLAAISMLGVPETGGYYLYLCSNTPRAGCVSEQMATLGMAPVVNIDTAIGGYAHDMSHASVANAIVAAASDPRCQGVLASPPCKTWSASRGIAAGGGLAFSQPLRDTDNPLGIQRADGSTPQKVLTANAVADCAALACRKAFEHGAGFIFEAPVARGKYSPFAIPGRESHVGVMEHPSVVALRLQTKASIINFDQCCTRDDPTQTPQKTTSLLASPNLAPAVQRLFGPLVCMHPVGTHPSMVGVDETGELRSSKWERYSDHMNKLLSMVFKDSFNTTPVPRQWSFRTKPAVACPPCDSSGPMAAWDAFYSTDAERIEHQPVFASQWSFVRQAGKHLGMDFSWNFFDTCLDGQCFPAVREQDSDSPSYKQAMNSECAAEWSKACNDEMLNLQRHEAADPVPEDTLSTWSKAKGYASEVANLLWVLKKKYISGVFDKFKARLVYDGRMQKINALNTTGTVMDTFSPTTRHVTHKLLIAQSVEEGGPSVTLSATSYIERIAKKYLPDDPDSYPSVHTPCGPNLISHYEDAVARRGTVDSALQASFAKKAGAVIYCLPSCRVDCAFTIGMCARCLTFPTPEVDKELNQCLVYLYQTRDRGLTFTKNGGDLVAEVDSNWTECHSTNGYVIKLAGAVVAYASKRQQSVALSSTEAEIMGASLAAAEIINIRGLLREMGRDMSKPTVLYVDNQGAIALSKDMRSCQRSRHIERRYLRIREWVHDGEIEVRYIATADNSADALTKPLDAKTFMRHVSSLMNISPATVNSTANHIEHTVFDIEAAYLKGEFNSDEIVYARPPLGYRHTIRGVPLVWRLKIPLYGEADAGRIWNRTLVKQLRDVQSFKQSEYDPCYFRKVFPDGKRIDILMYVDDGYVVTNAKGLADKELKQLHEKFTLTRKAAQYFLGNNLNVAI